MTPPSEPPVHPIRRVLVPVAKVVVSAALLWLLLGRVDLVRLLAQARQASVPWLLAALALYFAMVLVSAWRWALLLTAQGATVSARWLVNSCLVATFFNNFLPSNIGGDVIRIRDTAPATGSKTTATTIVLADRGLGLLGLLIVAAVAASGPGSLGPEFSWLPPLLWAAVVAGATAVVLFVLTPRVGAWCLSPLHAFNHDWVTKRVLQLTETIARLGQRPAGLLWCSVGAVVVQLILVAFYAAITQSMGIPIPVWHLAVLVPLSFLAQMVPISMNGFGVREAVFTYYFQRISLPAESALAVSFMGAALVMVFSLSGAAALASRAIPSRRPNGARTTGCGGPAIPSRTVVD